MSQHTDERSNARAREQHMGFVSRPRFEDYQARLVGRTPREESTCPRKLRNTIKRHRSTAAKPPSIMIKLLNSMTLANTRRPLITLTPLQVTSANLECMPTKPQRRTLMSTAKRHNDKKGSAEADPSISIQPSLNRSLRLQPTRLR